MSAEQSERVADVLEVPEAGRNRTTAEIWIVLGLSLGQSAVYAVISPDLAQPSVVPPRGSW